jgi:hypothetical protein
MGAATFRFYAELNDFLPVGDQPKGTDKPAPPKPQSKGGRKGA